MEGNPEAAIQRLEPLLDGRAEADISAAYGLALLAWAYLQGGRIDDAGHAAGEAVRLLRGAPGSRPGALRAQAAVAAARGDWEAAERGLVEMLRVAREAGSPGDEALALLDLGLLRLRRGDSLAGRDLINQALKTLRRLEIAPAVQQAEEALARAEA
jgi:tetratricopeptide (TPR) repeat protein